MSAILSEQPVKSGPRLRAVTLGCKVNQYETEFVRQALTGIGYQDAAADEHAELKRDQIPAFGKDDLIAGCKGSMSASIEPSE